MQESFDDYLQHYGIPGMKWGIRRSPEQLGHRSTSIRAVIARRENEKIDKSFKKWEEENLKKSQTIDLGKKRNSAKISYEQDRANPSLKKDYKNSERVYKKHLNKNTTYRKGLIRQEVGRDMARKYLAEAKKIKKQLENDPNNSYLKNQYDKFMSKHDVERASARKASEVGAARSRKIAAIKGGITKSIKSAVITAAIGIGATAVNSYLVKNGSIKLDATKVEDFIKKGQKFMRYVY